ncbi:hypothetical protein TcCL_Unassigned03009 [Trypanosoma cruzi]|nr:hypothetical protein TcCL_Unassigned03009 [Trypanosoma cruzi]
MAGKIHGTSTGPHVRSEMQKREKEENSGASHRPPPVTVGKLCPTPATSHTKSAPHKTAESNKHPKHCHHHPDEEIVLSPNRHKESTLKRHASTAKKRLLGL